MYSRMFWCCGTVANVEVPVPTDEKLSVNVPVVSKPLTLISRAPSVDQHIVVVPVQKEEITVCVDEVYTQKKCVVKKSTLLNLSRGVAAVAVVATAVYCLSNTENVAAILTPARNMYDFF
jgi:hypothetical protein